MNNTTGSGQEYKIYPLDYFDMLCTNHRTFYIGINIVYIIIGIFGLIGNVLSVVVLSTSGLRKTPLNLILLGLSIWDCVFIVTFLYIFECFGVIIQHVFGYERPYPWMYPYLFPLYLTCSSGSTVFKLLVTLERFLAVCQPLQIRSLITTRRTWITTCVTSVIIILFNLPYWWWCESVKISGLPLKNATKIQKSSFAKNSLVQACSDITDLLFRYLIPFIILIYCNIRIIQVLRKHQKIREQMTMKEIKDVSVTKMVLAIMSLSILRNTFFLIFFILKLFISKSWEKSFTFYFGELYSLMLLINSAVNFIFYFGTKLTKISKDNSTRSRFTSKD